MKQLNGSQKIQERKKNKDAQKCAEYISTQFPWYIDKCENNFMHLDHQDNTFHRSLKVSKRTYTIIDSSKYLITKRKVTKNQKKNEEIIMH